MNLLLVSPGYPADMPQFTRGLAEVGATVLGVGDQPGGALPEIVRESLSGYLHVRSLWDEQQVAQELRTWLKGKRLDRIECLREPGMLLAAQLRETLGVPGLTVEETLPFRDKERMKQVLDSAGVRTPRHFPATSVAQCWEACERIGFPVILKPIAGAGSSGTRSCRSARHAATGARHWSPTDSSCCATRSSPQPSRWRMKSGWGFACMRIEIVRVFLAICGGDR